MKLLVRKLIVFTIILSTTQIINLRISEFSVFQLILIITAVVSIVGLFKIKTIGYGKHIPFAVVSAVSSISAYFISTNTAWAKSYLLLGFMMSYLIFIIPIYFNVEDIGYLEKALIRSQYITLIFSVYSYYMFYFKNGIPDRIEIFKIMYIELDEAILRRAQVSNQIRLTLPYATPPVLSVVMAMCITILIFNKFLFGRKKRIFLLTAFTIVLVFTGSRTGIFSLAIELLIIGGYKFLKKGFKTKELRMAAGALIAIIALVIVSGKENYIAMLMNRIIYILNPKVIARSEHILYPLEGIKIWLDSLYNFALGIGFGTSSNITGKYVPELPPYFLNSYVTWIVERGLAGVYLIISILQLFFSNLRKGKESENYCSLLLALATALISCFFYETLNCYFVLILIAITFVLDKHHIQIKQ